ncbi:MAG TPA: long-chain fatty acid--CoA ligase [Candidatus Acidoferrales bacterium]|nr:long-chain fatty acid--CoA ligase [Candidatus Acidoferrales bacterium]
MRGTMMDFPLTLAPILERAGKLFGEVEIVSRRPDRSVTRCTYGDIHRRARRLARALQLAGMARGDRVATLMWNNTAHLECYFGIPAAGGVMHTLNLRLHPTELAYIANHARDRFLIVDDVLLPVYESFRSQVKLDRVFVVPFGGQPKPAGLESYEDFLAAADANFQYPAIDENEAAAMCFTSGTTGKSKGVVYSHRALVLHCLAQCLPDCYDLSQNDVVLTGSSMFHVNAWGLPYAATMAGAKIVLPGPHLDAESLLDLIVGENVNLGTGVPTIWFSVLQALEKHPGRWKFARPIRVMCGGSAPPESLFRGLDPFGIHVTQLWGMTETTPLATICNIKPNLGELTADEQYALRTKAGFGVPFVELRVMRAEGEAPQDGVTSGELEVRGPWIAGSYFQAPETSDRWSKDGWFRTGDVATIDPEGYVKIVDRTKDMIKSGGEWISSLDIENALMSHPAVREAAVIGLPHPRWQERPLAVVVLHPGAQAQTEELRAFLATKFAKWQLPDSIVFTKEIPRTSVGKFLKSKLREEYANWEWK